MNLSEVINEVDVLHDHNRDDFQDFTWYVIEGMSEDAINFDGKWIPKSQLRVDFDNNIYISTWLYAKIF